MAKIRDGATYLGGHLTSNDYYNKNESVTGVWVGNLAKEWGLEGQPINEGDKSFENLRLGRTPNGKDSLTQRGGGSVRFFDFQCSAQKSVSIMAVTLKDNRLREAHERISKESFEEALQRCASRRVRDGAKTWSEESETTGKVVAAAFTHDAARVSPMDDYCPDPQLHTHFVVANATLGKDGERYALEPAEMCRAIRYAGKSYQSGMARACRELGYEIEEKRNHKGEITGFEISGVSDELLQRFSKRRGDVRAAIAKFTMETGREPTSGEIHVLTLQSRGEGRNKLPEFSTAEVLQKQLSQLTHHERESLENLRDKAKENPSPASAEVSDDECDEAVERALAHIIERESLLKRHHLEAEAMAQGLGTVSRSGVSLAVDRLVASGNLVTLNGSGVQAIFSTPSILEMENQCVVTVNRGRGGCAPLAPFLESSELSAEQNAALKILSNSKDRFVSLRGVAGTGKTTTLKYLNERLCVNRQKALYLAPTTSAVKQLKKELGCEAMTVAAYLQALEGPGRKRYRNHVLIVDESGLLSLNDGSALIKNAERLKQRCLYVGDVRQHGPVGREFLGLLEAHSQITKAEISDIRRQTVREYKNAVTMMAAGKSRDGLKHLQEMGWVESVGADYLKRGAEVWWTKTAEGTALGDCILCSPTWAEAHAVTAEIRTRLKAAGKLGASRKRVLSESISWTLPQRKNLKNYLAGMIVTGVRDSAVLKGGESATVREVKDGQVILDNGRTFAPAKFAAFLDVGLAREVDFACGDLLLVRQNLKSQKLVNGEVLQVASISPDGEIQTKCGKIIPSGFSKISHGYSVTSHKAQGMTSRHSVVVAAQLDSKSTYVACSRGRESCVVVTPDAETLLSRLPEGSKRNAMDFVAGKTNALNKLHSHLSARRRQLHAWASRMMRVDSKRLLRIVKAGRRYLRTAIGQSILRTRRSTLFPMKTVSLPLPLPVWGTATLRTGRGGK
jgi:conjugative relaxase-like TrwC/TraI family protein